MKFVSGIEELQIKETRRDQVIEINGRLPWVTNLRPGGFDVAVAVQRQGGSAFVVSLSSDDEGLKRSNDLDLMAMRATNTAALKIKNIRIDEDRIIHPKLQRVPSAGTSSCFGIAMWNVDRPCPSFTGGSSRRAWRQSRRSCTSN